MKEGYKSIDEILKEVAEEEGIPVYEIKDVWEHQKHYVKKQMDTEGVYAIFLPFIGTLSLNVTQFKRELRGKTRSIYINFIEKVKNLVKHENYKEFLNSHKKITGVNKLARQIIRDYDTGQKKTKQVFLHKKCWEIIAKYSNGQYKKKTD